MRGISRVSLAHRSGRFAAVNAAGSMARHQSELARANSVRISNALKVIDALLDQLEELHLGDQTVVPPAMTGRLDRLPEVLMLQVPETVRARLNAGIRISEVHDALLTLQEPLLRAKLESMGPRAAHVIHLDPDDDSLDTGDVQVTGTLELGERSGDNVLAIPGLPTVPYARRRRRCYRPNQAEVVRARVIASEPRTSTRDRQRALVVLRLAENDRTSLAALARDLGVDPPALIYQWVKYWGRFGYNPRVPREVLDPATARPA